MRKKEYRSVAVKLSLRFSVLLAAAVLLLSVLFSLTLRRFIRMKQSSDLFNAAGEIEKDLSATNTSNRLYLFSNVPYFITYTVYDAVTGIVLSVIFNGKIHNAANRTAGFINKPKNR